MPIHIPSLPVADAAKLRRLGTLPLALLIGALPALLLLLAASNSAQAGSGTVTHCSDDSQLSALLAGGGAIAFNCGPGLATITFASQKVIAQPTTIDGGGRVTFSGGGVTRLFSVTAGVSLGLANLTLYDGHVISDNGGAIDNQGNLTLLNMTIVSNTAAVLSPTVPLGTGGGVFNAASGNLTVTNSSFIDNRSFSGYGGAGIFSSGALTVTGSTFRGNFGANLGDGVGDGGGIQTAAGTALIVNSTFLSNTAGYGGAIDNDGASSLTLIGSYLAYNVGIDDGGAIDVDTTGVQAYISDTFAYNSSPKGWGGAVWAKDNLTIQDSTFSGNRAGVVTPTGQAGGAIFNSNGPLTITNSTIFNNVADLGGGIYNSGAMTVTNSTLFSNTFLNLYVHNGVIALKNTIVANGSLSNCDDLVGSISSLGHNLESANTCGLSAGGDITDTNPLLGPLGNNGGPTPTLPLLPGSPAIDHGDNSGCPATDQRGGARLVDGKCDIGAYEFGVVIATLFLPLVRK